MKHPTRTLAPLGSGGDPERTSMQLRIVHTTGFEYAGKATASFNEARLTPQTTPGQIVVHTRLEVHPTPWTYTYRDYWGTHVTAFEVLDPHESMTVTASSTVHVLRSPAAGVRRPTCRRAGAEVGAVDPLHSWHERGEGERVVADRRRLPGLSPQLRRLRRRRDR